MQPRRKSDILQQFAAVSTWAIVTGLAAYVAFHSDEVIRNEIAMAIGLAIVNLAAMWFTIGGRDRPRQQITRALGIQLISALLMGWLLPLSFLPIYTIIWIGIASSFYSFRTCCWILVGILLAWYLIFSVQWENNDPHFTVLLYATFHLFAMLTARNAAEAQAARAEVESLNGDLLATQQLLGEASRQQERTRIARNLHDMLGHHLTALSINLQIAERLTTGEARDKVEESRALARLLLSDVREAVSTLREEPGVNLSRALEVFAQHVPGLEVEIDIDDEVTVDDVDVAQVIVRCVQEAVTNTLRHASADRAYVRIWSKDACIHVDVHDNGRLRTSVNEGNGLKGMRERLATVKGSLELDELDGALRLRASIPLAS